MFTNPGFAYYSFLIGFGLLFKFGVDRRTNDKLD